MPSFKDFEKGWRDAAHLGRLRQWPEVAWMAAAQSASGNSEPLPNEKLCDDLFGKQTIGGRENFARRRADLVLRCVEAWRKTEFPLSISVPPNAAKAIAREFGCQIQFVHDLLVALREDSDPIFPGRPFWPRTDTDPIKVGLLLVTGDEGIVARLRMLWLPRESVDSDRRAVELYPAPGLVFSEFNPKFESGMEKPLRYVQSLGVLSGGGDIKWWIENMHGNQMSFTPLTPIRCDGPSAGAAFALGLLRLASKLSHPQGLDHTIKRLLADVAALDLDRTSISAECDERGRLSKIGDIEEKFGRHFERCRMQRLLTNVILSNDQGEAFLDNFKSSASFLQVHNAGSIVEAVAELHRQTATLAAVREWEKEQSKWMELIGGERVLLEDPDPPNK